MNIQYRKMLEQETDVCVDLAVRAFWNDPFFRAAAGNTKNYRMLMDLLTRVWMESQTVLVAETDGRLAALAILAEEKDAAVSLGACLRLGAWDVLKACGWRNMLAFLRASGRFGKRFQTLRGPKFFLTLLAVEPGMRRKGIGSAILADCVLPFLRERGGGTLCLNTNEERNRAFYRKNHFEEVGTSAARIGHRTVPGWSFRMALSEKHG